MRGPAGAFFLVSLQLLVGTFGLLWATQLVYRFINRGYYRSAVWVLWPLQLALAFALPEPLRPLGFATAVGMALFLASVYSQRPLLEWLSGALATGAGLWMIVSAGQLACDGCLGVLHALSGTAVMGAITHGMVLGHWYLNQARLPIQPLMHATVIMFVTLALSAVAGIATRPTLVEGAVPGSVVAFSAQTFWLTWLLLLAATAVIGAMVYATVRSRSTQSATGLLYIAIVTGLGAQFILDLLVAT